MSQAKVDKYKEYKKNRKKLIAQEKRRKKAVDAAVIGVITLLALALVIFVGASVFNRIKKSTPKYDYVSKEFVLADYASIMATEAPTTEAPTTVESPTE